MTALFPSSQLNARSLRLCQFLVPQADELRVRRFPISRPPDPNSPFGCWDFGIQAQGGLAAGLLLARVCLSDLAEVTLGTSTIGPWPQVSLYTDYPLAACMASQYAGWKIGIEGFFAMGSGPMRAAAGSEKLFETIGFCESPDAVIGVCETGQVPALDLVEYVADACRVSPSRVLLLVAPTRSQAGSVQIVARSVETALHQMHVKGWDLKTVASAQGTAPLPPVAANDLAGIGRTNDAILYGGRVTIWLMGEDAELAELAGQITSAASPDHGQPFAEIFARYERDFYRVDPQLFAPAEVHLVNLATGRTFSAGHVDPDLLHQSFLN